MTKNLKKKVSGSRQIPAASVSHLLALLPCTVLFVNTYNTDREGCLVPPTPLLQGSWVLTLSIIFSTQFCPCHSYADICIFCPQLDVVLVSSGRAGADVLHTPWMAWHGAWLPDVTIASHAPLVSDGPSSAWTHHARRRRVFCHLLRTLRLHPQAVSPLSRALCCFPCCCMPCCPTARFAHVLPQALTRGPVTVRLCITTAPGVCDTIGNTRVIIALAPGCYVRSSTPGRGPVRGQV